MSSTSPHFVPVQASFKLELPPVQDSPSTPATPDTPHDITVSVAGVGTASPSSSVSASTTEFKLSSADSVLPPFPGTWKVCRDKNSTPTSIFEPASCDAAKHFIRSSVKILPRFIYKTDYKPDPLDTPKSSKTVTPNMPCHGCHLQMGQGAHQGSAPGKNHCTLPHSLSCQGGVVEDDSWRACPDGYVYHGQVVPGSGFVDTMNQSQFLSSTPILPHAGLQAHPHQQSPVGAQAFPQQAAPDVSAGQQSLTAGAARPLPQQAVPTVSAVQLSLASGAAPPMPQQAFPSNSLQMTPSVLTLGQQTSTGPVQSTPITRTTVSTSVHFPSNITTQGQSAHAPPMYSTPSPTLASLEYDMLRLSLQQMGEGARPRTSVQPLADVSPGVQLQVDTLRAANQQVANASDPSTAGLNIADLRALPALQDVVNNQMQYLRGSVPALSAAKSAPAPGVQQQPPLSLPSVHLNFPTPTSGLQLGPASSFLPPQPAPQAGIHLVLPQSVHLHQPSQVTGVQQHQSAPVPGSYQQHGGGVTGTPGQASSGPQYQPAPPVPIVQHGIFPSPASGVQHSAPAPGFYQHQHTPGHQSGHVQTPGRASGGHQQH